jgi:hypothetical protein
MTNPVFLSNKTPTSYGFIIEIECSHAVPITAGLFEGVIRLDAAIASLASG